MAVKRSAKIGVKGFFEQVKKSPKDVMEGILGDTLRLRKIVT